MKVLNQLMHRHVIGTVCLIGHKCFALGLKAFNRLCDVDAELKRFNETLFSSASIRLRMCNLHPSHKLKIDEQISLFMFLISTHVRSPDVIWAFEWLVYR